MLLNAFIRLFHTGRGTNSPRSATPGDCSVAHMAAGSVCRVECVSGDAYESTRLRSLGICEGRELRVVRAGNPLIVGVLGTRVGLSQQLAASVRVAS
ncbi:FeoA domain protein [Pseudobythopirellula maris]|uniref:FeoA domain protein n=1 Tax=Pseudobythopirellula maris TaxID=2527991 RepID=A0A5C5ZQT7_9BACT|nr:FeoA family protein [Pseudobythopirellula maris]TWT88663.1 FeoA domain protein [Pseudobythopirellula maris]